MPWRTSASAACTASARSARAASLATGTGEVEQAGEGSLHLECRLGDELQANLVVGSGRHVFEQEIDEPEHAEEGIRDVVGDVCGQVAERGRACEGQELTFDGRPLDRPGGTVLLTKESTARPTSSRA